MDIAAMSMELSAARLQQSVGISIAKKTMDAQEMEVQALMDMVDAADSVRIPSDGVGQIVDVMA